MHCDGANKNIEKLTRISEPDAIGCRAIGSRNWRNHSVLGSWLLLQNLAAWTHALRRKLTHHWPIRSSRLVWKCTEILRHNRGIWFLFIYPPRGPSPANLSQDRFQIAPQCSEIKGQWLDRQALIIPSNTTENRYLKYDVRCRWRFKKGKNTLPLIVGI